MRDHSRISRGATIFELTITVATLALWLQLDAFPRVFHIFGVTITLSSRWPYFFWGLAMLTLAGIGISCLHLATSRWTRLSASLRLGIDCCSFGLFYWLCRADMLQSLSGNDVSSTDAIRLVSSLNHGMASSAIWVLLIGAIVVVFDVRRILRVVPTASSIYQENSGV